MLEAIKAALFITDSDMDSVISADIAAALGDMQRVGVTAAVESSDSPCVIKCVELYVKWQQDFLGLGDQFLKNYEKMRDGLSQCGDFNADDAE